MKTLHPTAMTPSYILWLVGTALVSSPAQPANPARSEAENS